MQRLEGGMKQRYSIWRRRSPRGSDASKRMLYRDQAGGKNRRADLRTALPALRTWWKDMDINETGRKMTTGGRHGRRDRTVRGRWTAHLCLSLRSTRPRLSRGAALRTRISTRSASSSVRASCHTSSCLLPLPLSRCAAARCCAPRDLAAAPPPPLHTLLCTLTSPLICAYWLPPALSQHNGVKQMAKHRHANSISSAWLRAAAHRHRAILARRAAANRALLLPPGTSPRRSLRAFRSCALATRRCGINGAAFAAIFTLVLAASSRHRASRAHSLRSCCSYP